MATNYIARQDGEWIVISVAPDVCLTPLGGIPVPVPYPVVSSLSAAQQTTTTVNVNSNPIVVFDTSFAPTTQGDEAGSNGGVMSGTTAQKARPIQHSATVNIEGKAIVRAFDLFWMNGP